MPHNNRSAIEERREKISVLLTRGMKGYEIAKELGVDSATVSRDIKYLTADSQTYLNDLAKITSYRVIIYHTLSRNECMNPAEAAGT